MESASTRPFRLPLELMIELHKLVGVFIEQEGRYF
jgi:hypothetical protein